MATETTTTDQFHLCACSTLEIVLATGTKVPVRYADYQNFDLAEPEASIDGTLETGCTQVTRRVFAPGHDARAKGLLQFAHRNNLEVRIQDGGMLISTDAKGAVSRFPNLADAVLRAESPKAERKPRAAKARKVWAKVGRWTYQGTLNAAGQFVYSDKNDAEVVVDKFTLVTGKS